jgi:GNAT superfamily N-acetyltransferase
MEFVVLGWPPDGPTLKLDYRRFSYAGKFVMSATGKAVAREDEILAATAFNADHTDEDRLWIRYVTVREDHRGRGLGPALLRFTAERALGEGFEEVGIAVNNPFAYEAAYRAGFAFTGEETGIAELVCSYHPDGDRDPAQYQDGLGLFHERDLQESEDSFLASRQNETPPEVVDVPESGGDSAPGDSNG